MSIYRRHEASGLDDILGKKFEVLDQGFICPVDYMGTDASIVQAARVSYGEGTKTVHEDEGLIRYLMRHRHTTPFEMCEIKLHIRCPMDVWRQWIRHRTASVNEYSTRYSIAIDATQKTKARDWRLQSTRNKQGSEGTLNEDDAIFLTDQEEELHKVSRTVYEDRIEKGIAREQARKDLPLSTYTEAYWKIDLHNLFHFLSLRMDIHAQHEIRQYANVIGEQILPKWVPMAWRAFCDYRLNSTFLTFADTIVIRAVTQNNPDVALQLAQDMGWLEPSEKGGLKSNRERQECEAKLHHLGITPPWI